MGFYLITCNRRGFYSFDYSRKPVPYLVIISFTCRSAVCRFQALLWIASEKVSMGRF